MKIAIFGTGYVGLVTGACFASKGHEVICVDVVPEKVEMINNSKSPIYEKGLDELLKNHVPTGLLRATLNAKDAVENAEIIFICVGTPSLPDGSMDYQYVEQSAKDIAEVFTKDQEYKVVVVKSTCIPGTTVNLVGPILEKTSGLKVGEDFGLGMNPEFLREGVAVQDFLYPDRIVVGGVDKRSLDSICKCYNEFNAPILTVDPTAAEMIKYTSNSFLACKISFINEMANLCEVLGIDVNDVAKGVGMDHRISDKFLRSGAGFGGSCFPKDVKALYHKSKEVSLPSKLLEATLRVNEIQPLRTIDLLKEELQKEKQTESLKDLKIAVLGLAFKPETDDMREAPSLIILQQLLEEGAKVTVTDPIAIENAKKEINHSNLTFEESIDETLKEADACILVTEWKEFQSLPPEKFLELMKQPILIDGRKVYDYQVFRNKGIIYRAIGLGK